jgi:hypothetical protein
MMTRYPVVGVGCLALVIASGPTLAAARGEGGQAASTAAAAAAASPDLVGALANGIGATPEQAAGAAGALFGLAKSRLKPQDFQKIAGAVPGMDQLLQAAPALGAVSAASGALAGVSGSAGGLAGAASAFSKLGLKPELVSKAVPLLTSMVTKSGGADVGALLAGVLK